MKKLLAFIMALLMLVPFGVVAFANTGSTKYCTVYTGDTTAYYNSDRRVTIVLSLRDINFGKGDGVSAFAFELYYDKNRLTPVTKAAEDSDGDKGDFSKLMSTKPEGWECFGTLDEEKGVYDFSFFDNSGKGSVVEDDALVIKIPFQAAEDARVTDLVFNFDNMVAYSGDMEDNCIIELDAINIPYSVQPAVNATLPSNAIKIDVAGYRHDINNVIYYAKTKTTVGEYIKKYCPTTNKQDRMSNFGIVIADIDGIITYVNTSVGTSSNKSSVVIPEGSFIIGVHSSKSSDFAAFKSVAKVGKQVTVYNVNVESIGNSELAQELNRAAFTITDISENKPPFVGGDNPDEPILPSDPDIKDPVTDPDDDPVKDPDEVPDDYMLGDVNDNGEIDSMDYILLKRNYFGTYKFTNDQFKRGDVNKSNEIDSMDYILLKRAYFGTYKIKG